MYLATSFLSSVSQPLQHFMEVETMCETGMHQK